MIKTSKEFMEWLGLQVGDNILVTYAPDDNDVFEVSESNNKTIWLKGIKGTSDNYEIGYILDADFEILPRPKRVGDLKCDEFECCDCPLNYICNLNDWGFSLSNSLYGILELFNCDDQEIHDLLKARLDKEME